MGWFWPEILLLFPHGNELGVENDGGENRARIRIALVFLLERVAQWTFGKEMKAIPLLGTLFVIATQTITFLGLWSWMVSIARSHDRFPPELFLGITIHYGSIWIVSLFIVCGLVAFLSTKPLMRWIPIFAGLLAWLFWLWPSFDSRPFAMPSFFALGATILIVGTGFGIPCFRRIAARFATRNANGKRGQWQTGSG